MNINNFFFNKKTINLVDDWINKDYKDNFLFIHGKISCGKTSLAKCILKKYKIIHINIDFFKGKLNLKEYLDLSLGRKNVLMMFKGEFQYNAIIFDNLELFLKHQKSIFNEIISYLNKLNIYKKNHPIIFISSNINHKYFKKILCESKFIEINYTHNNIVNITKKLLSSKNIEISNDEMNDLIRKSDMKISNIISNIDILKLNNNYSQVYDYNDNFISDIIKKIYESNNFSDIMRYSQNTNNLYFDILDNIHFLTKDINIISKIYKINCSAENVNTFYIKNHLDLYDLYILLSIIYPKYYLNNQINQKKIINNKYVSKSLIYISNQRHIQNNNLDVNILYLINESNNNELNNFIKEKYNIKGNDIKKLQNLYDKIINF